MKNFYQYILENTNNIQIDISHFKSIIYKELENLIDYYNDLRYQIKNFSPNNGFIENLLKEYPRKEYLIKSVGTQKFNGEIGYLFKWSKENRDYRFASQAYRYLDNQHHSLLKTDPYLSNDELNQKYEDILKETLVNMELIKNYINEAISRMPNWNNSLITITANESYDYNLGNKISFEPGEDAYVYVGKNATFSIFMNNKQIQEIDDILESGEDEEFFPDEKIKSDYYNLIKELKNPGSVSQGKNLTLFTARPAKDREFYSNTNYLPNGIFLTNSASHAEGLATDLTSGEPRDVWKVIINSKYLLQTLDGPIKYFMVNVENAPAKISLY